MHWLRKLPVNLSNHIHMVGAEGEELKAFGLLNNISWLSHILYPCTLNLLSLVFPTEVAKVDMLAT